MGLTATEVPPRLRRALDAFEGLQDAGLYLVPVRHHSPACALAVAALVRAVRPAAVLIEGPEEYTSLVGALQDPATVPPVAVLSIARSGPTTSSAFYPLAEFSPEWVALRAAGEASVPAAFIDRPWTVTADAVEEHLTRTLQEERYLADSRTLAEIARREHCRDHDELWEQLIELRPRDDLADWRRTCHDVLVWSALARLDYEPEVLAAEGSLDREARMAARVREWRERVDGPVVVVTGGFHTLALVEALTGAPEGEEVRALEPAGGYGPPAPEDAAAWLIRYDFARLDALRGYGAGMPSPGFHQRMWRWLTAPDPAGADQVTAELLVDVARQVHGAGAYDRTGTAATAAALEQAMRLAHLRGRPWPGRTDVLDAITSCFVDDSGPDAALREAVDHAFGGHALGEVPPGTAAPPVVAEARRTAERLRLVVTDSLPRTTATDPVRSPGQRERSRFLALMEFLGTGFSRRLGGPDLVRGQGLGLLQEQWQYAWTPMVEARLIDLAHQGGTLLDIAEATILAAEHALDTSPERRSAAGAVQVLAQAAVIGLGSRLRPLVALVGSHLDVDPSLGSVVGAAHRTLALWRARTALGLDDATDGAEPIGDALLRLLHEAVPAAAYLVLGGARPAPDDEERAVAALVAVHDLLRELDGVLDVTALAQALDRARLDPDTSPGVRGALVALGVVDGVVGDDELSAQLVAHLGTGADVEVSVRFLAGVMTAAPDLLLHTPALVDAVGGALTRMSDEAFLAALPELRRSFARLRPTETAQLAEHVAGPAGGLVDVRHSDLTEADLAEGVALEQTLSRSLADEALLAWVLDGDRS